jgi:hypothetical protein
VAYDASTARAAEAKRDATAQVREEMQAKLEAVRGTGVVRFAGARMLQRFPAARRLRERLRRG